MEGANAVVRFIGWFGATMTGINRADVVGIVGGVLSR